uniref:Uncharacterized protein n=1 Tax=Physcomitrium patens TaxID=3218 RepID=A0A2K1IMY6_PHYPA|nr:hypothetical protein PHYPA_026955 [Physcomitrium patens]
MQSQFCMELGPRSSTVEPKLPLPSRVEDFSGNGAWFPRLACAMNVVTWQDDDMVVSVGVILVLMWKALVLRWRS